MVNCPTCNQALPIIAEIGALSVHTGAHLVSWQGEIIPLMEAERSLVKAILMKGSATWAQLKEALHPDGEVSTNLLNVSLSRVRRKLKEAAVAYDIKAIRGWGVILVDHDSGLPFRSRSSSNWIEKASRHSAPKKLVVAH